MNSSLTEEQISLIHKLRKEIGCGMMDARKALHTSNWEYNKALLYLQSGKYLAFSTDTNYWGVNRYK